MRWTVLLFLLVLASCHKESTCDDPSALNQSESADCQYADTAQHALFFKFTGAWCPPCGSRAAVKMRETLRDYPNTIGIEVHYNDVMKSDIGYKFLTHFGIGSFPRYRYNNDEVSSIEDAFKSPATIGGFQTFRVKDSKMEVEGKLVALENLPNHTYNISVYLLEDGYIHYQYADDHTAYPEWEFQNGQYPNYIHKRILRDEASGHIFGRVLTDETWNEGEVVSFSASMDIPESVQGELYPVAVIWRENNREYEFVNAFSGL